MLEATVVLSLTDQVSALSVSDTIEEMLGYPVEHFLSNYVSLRELIHPHDEDISEMIFSPDSADCSGVCNIRVRQANGRIRCLKGLYKKRAGEDGAGTMLELLLQDAKSLKRTLDDAGAMPNFSAMMDNTDDYIYFKDRNHVFTGASQTLVSLCDPAEHWTDLIGLTDYDVFPEEYADIYYNLEKQVFSGVPIAHEIQETLAKDGRKGWVDNRKYPINDETGKIIGLFGIARDITERKRLEIYRSMGQDILLALSNTENKKTAIQKVIGLIKAATSVDAVGIRLQDEDDFPYFYQEGFPQEFLQKENSILTRTRDGGICRDECGNVCLECTCGLVISGKTDPANALFTKRGSSWTNNSFPFLLVPADEDPRLNPHNECIHQGYASVALIPIRAKGRIVGLLQLNHHRTGFFSLEEVETLENIAENIGEAMLRKQAEEELQKSNTLNQSIIDSSTDCIKLLDLEGRLQYMSLGGQLTLGIQNINDFLNISYEDFWKGENREAALKAIDSARHGIPGSFEGYCPTLDGTPKWWEVIISPVKGAEGTPEKLLAVSRDISERKSLQENILKQTLQLEEELAERQLIQEELQEQTALLEEEIEEHRRTEDALSRMLAERIKLEEQLRQSQKMEAIGLLAGGVAHDFNNILTVIMGYCSLLEMESKSDPKLKEATDQIMSATEKAVQLTKGLLAFSRRQVLSVKKENLNNIIHHVEKFVARIIGEDILLKSICIVRELPVTVDASQIEQVLINLATNARDAMPKGGNLTIETSYQEITDSFQHAHGNAPLGRYACISMSDTGCGMDEETRSKIFEPFFTTKEMGKGTGLGMAIVYGIIQQHNGFISVYSEKGEGTTFRIYLPIAAAQEVELAEGIIQAEPHGGTEVILLAEDDASVRKLTATFLTKFGYDVIQAVDGLDAIEKFTAHQNEVRLLLMDMIMPKMNGREAYDEIRKINPYVKVLYSSGYTADFIQSRGVSEEGIELIMKPVQPMDLLRKVREMLDR